MPCCGVHAVCVQAVLRVMLHGADELERSGASHLLAAFCQDNNLGQMAVLSTVVYAGRWAVQRPVHSVGVVSAGFVCTHCRLAAAGNVRSTQHQLLHVNQAQLPLCIPACFLARSAHLSMSACMVIICSTEQTPAEI